MRFEIAVRSVILAPEVNMQKPLPVGFVGQQMTYQIAATDPQGEKLTYVLEGLVRYDSYPANPLPIGIGETITVTLKVSDGKGGEALQTYLTGVHADPVR